MGAKIINIISKCAVTNKVNGPAKVFRNLVKGLSLCGYQYTINQKPSSKYTNYIHDDISSLIVTPRGLPLVIGPNIFSSPKDIPGSISLDSILLLQPSDWTIKGWINTGYTTYPMKKWPVGIDTYKFSPINGKSSNKISILVMYKDYLNKPALPYLDNILKSLYSHNITVHLRIYGYYSDVEYQHLLQGVSGCLWYGMSESQGIGLLEALSTNVPILAINMDTPVLWNNNSGLNSNLKTSTAPYFSRDCGLLLPYNDAIASIPFFLSSLSNYSPRQYILDNLSLERQATEFVKIVQNWTNCSVLKTQPVPYHEISSLNTKLFSPPYFSLFSKLKRFSLERFPKLQ